jgi:hypothetical protein
MRRKRSTCGTVSIRALFVREGYGQVFDDLLDPRMLRNETLLTRLTTNALALLREFTASPLSCRK